MTHPDLAVLTWATFENGKFEVTKLMAMPVHAHVSHPSTICTHDSSSAFAGIPMHACNVANLGRSSLCNLYRQPSSDSIHAPFSRHFLASHQGAMFQHFSMRHCGSSSVGTLPEGGEGVLL